MQMTKNQTMQVKALSMTQMTRPTFIVDEIEERSKYDKTHTSDWEHLARTESAHGSLHRKSIEEVNRLYALVPVAVAEPNAAFVPMDHCASYPSLSACSS